jgi:hypothetical protein
MIDPILRTTQPRPGPIECSYYSLLLQGRGGLSTSIEESETKLVKVRLTVQLRLPMWELVARSVAPKSSRYSQSTYDNFLIMFHPYPTDRKSDAKFGVSPTWIRRFQLRGWTAETGDDYCNNKEAT